MAVLTVRNIPDEVHRALRIRAAEHGRSTEAEIRAILENTVKPTQRMHLGDVFVSLAQQHGLSNADVELLEHTLQQNKPAEPLSFE